MTHGTVPELPGAAIRGCVGFAARTASRSIAGQRTTGRGAASITTAASPSDSNSSRCTGSPCFVHFVLHSLHRRAAKNRRTEVVLSKPAPLPISGSPRRVPPRNVISPLIRYWVPSVRPVTHRVRGARVRLVFAHLRTFAGKSGTGIACFAGKQTVARFHAVF